MVWSDGSSGEYTATVSVASQTVEKQIFCVMTGNSCGLHFFGLDLLENSISVSVQKSSEDNSVTIDDDSGMTNRGFNFRTKTCHSVFFNGTLFTTNTCSKTNLQVIS